MIRKTDNPLSPFLKWVGGKRQLLDRLRRFLPDDAKERLYCEPFIGGGALLFDLQPSRALIADINQELVNCYRVIRDNPDALVESLRQHQNTPEYYYQIRGVDRSEAFSQLGEVERASRVIYLNKTCYNGLYRVNASGCFNTPFGRYKSPNIVNEYTIRAVSQYLNTAEIEILHADYQTILMNLPSDSFVYLDPPYHPLSPSSSFTGYVQGGWTEEDQLRLRDTCRVLSERGIPFLQSNSSAEFIRQIYTEFHIDTVQATRSVNSRGDGRGQVDEFLISNYK